MTRGVAAGRRRPEKLLQVRRVGGGRPKGQKEKQNGS